MTTEPQTLLESYSQMQYHLNKMIEVHNELLGLSLDVRKELSYRCESIHWLCVDLKNAERRGS